MAREPQFSNGRKGAALPVRVIPRASKSQIVEILSDQTVKIRISAPADENKANEELIRYLSEVLGLPVSRFEIVAGEKGRDKLVSILDISTNEVHKKILENVL
ncbi:MAG TPA: DUF167 domain-containing protein [Anaerolineales bacterium]|nr:DUF167 domain-containing protein [Anaerolineales bacterium]